MTSPKFVFVAGVPGSSWSMLSHRLKSMIDADPTDYDENRTFKFGKHKELGSHHGCYFGPNNEFGEHFDDIASNYTLEEFVNECQLPFAKDDKPKMIRSHWFSRQLDWLWDNFKGHDLFLIYKNDQIAFDHWIMRGGFDITHPVYTWYKDPENMRSAIALENSAILDFAARKQLVWDNYSEDWWFTRFGTHETKHPGRPREDEYINNSLRVIYVSIT
jgi:hypothetical protein